MKKRWRQVVFFAIQLGFWLVLSGRLDPVFVVLGIASAAVVTLAATPLLEHTIGRAGTHPRVRVLPLITYSGWLFGRMMVSAVQIAWIVLNPRVPPKPGIVRLRTDLRSPAARAMLANSTTLVPGTMTLNISDREMVVHSFTPDAVEDLATAAMQNRIARIFGDDHQEPPELHWEEGHRLEDRPTPDGEVGG
jgi:multicomponent Na+:H+ antiporter subunit E